MVNKSSKSQKVFQVVYTGGGCGRWGSRGGGALPYKKDGGACLTFLELKKAVLLPLRVFLPQQVHSFFVVSFRALSQENMTWDNVCFRTDTSRG